MEQIESARAVTFGDEVIVELQGTDEHGVIDVVSYQFDYEGDGRTLTPKDPVADEHASLVREALEEKDFRWRTPNAG